MNKNNPLHEKYVICSDIALKKDIMKVAMSYGYSGLTTNNIRIAKVIFFGSRGYDNTTIMDHIAENYLENHECTEIKVEDILDDEYIQKRLKLMRVLEELNE